MSLRAPRLRNFNHNTSYRRARAIERFYRDNAQKSFNGANVRSCPRSGPAFRPDAGKRVLLADPRLVLETGLEGLAMRPLGQRCTQSLSV